MSFPQRTALCCIASAAFALPAFSQTTTSISGLVTDSLGAAVPKANVAIHSTDNRVSRITITDG